MSALVWIAIGAYVVGGLNCAVFMWRDIYATGMPESSFKGARMKHAGNKRYATLWSVFFGIFWGFVVAVAALAWVGGVAHNWIMDGDK